MVLTVRFWMKFELSSEEEASSAEEQLASNSLMQDDNRGSLYELPLYHYRIAAWLKKPISLFLIFEV